MGRLRHLRKGSSGASNVSEELPELVRHEMQRKGTGLRARSSKVVRCLTPMDLSLGAFPPLRILSHDPSPGARHLSQISLISQITERESQPITASSSVVRALTWVGKSQTLVPALPILELPGEHPTHPAIENMVGGMCVCARACL